MNYDNSGVHQWHFRHDALEAFNSFSAARNLCFWATILCILLIQGVFYSVSRGVIDPALELPAKESVSQPSLDGINDGGGGEVKEINNGQRSETEIHNSGETGGFVLCGYTSRLPEIMPETYIIDINEENPDNTKTQVAKSQEKAESEKANAQMIISTLKKVISGANVVVVFSILMYCICLFFSIQLSLVGSLGGMSSSTRAFFPALLAALLIIPWSKTISPGIPTSIFTFDQIITHYTTRCYAECSTYGNILYYARFSGIWAVVLILLFISQWRSCHAVKEISQRAQDWKSINPIESKPSANQESRKATSGDSGPNENNEPIPLA